MNTMRQRTVVDEGRCSIMQQNNKTKRTLTSIVSYPERGDGGSNQYRGNCSPKLIEDLISFFKPDMICDYMCGSGTTRAAAEKCGIQSRIYDLHSGFDLMNSDIPERPEFIFWHPPYWDIVTYSDVMYKAAEVQEKYGYDPRQFDLSRIHDWDKFVDTLNRAMLKQFYALQKGGRMAILMGDIKKKGKLYSMLAEIAKPGVLENIIIKAQHNCFSDRTQYSGKFIPILHEYVMIIRKDDGLTIPVLLSCRRSADIRDVPGATWRDIISAVMEQANEPVTLPYLYERIEPHKRAQESKWWKEKIRQTLQYHPQVFHHTGRGIWELNRKAGSTVNIPIACQTYSDAV